MMGNKIRISRLRVGDELIVSIPSDWSDSKRDEVIRQLREASRKAIVFTSDITVQVIRKTKRKGGR